jgi:DNA topoisomerase-2
MAQNFVGSNNLNLLLPNGNFGTRRLGGKDASSSRYIFTQLNEATKNIFKQDDECILTYNYEDGTQIEPKTYYPIIPMILVNGSEGIGTGYSTFIPSYNPLDIIENIKKYLAKGDKEVVNYNELQPWYRGFTGKITKTNDSNGECNGWQISGSYTIVNENTIKITELPVGVWTEPYREFLEELIDDGTIINNYDDNSGIQNIDITIYFVNNALQQLLKTNSIEKKLKLTTSIKTTNMHLYKNNVICKYKNANQILDDFIKIRLEMYDLRKKYIVKILLNELAIIKYRKMFIEKILDKDIVIERKKKEEIIQVLKDKKFPELAFNLDNTPSYDYLTNLPLWSLTFEKIEEMNKEFANKNNQLDVYTNTSIQQLWLDELELFEESYRKYLNVFEKEKIMDAKSKIKTTKKDAGGKKTISVKTN